MGWQVKISEAFELYRLEHIVYLNQSKRTEEMSLYAMNSFIKYAGDLMMNEVTFDVLRKWKEQLMKTRSEGTVRQYVLKFRCVLKHLQISGYDVLNYERVGIPQKKADRVVDFLTPEEVSHLMDVAFAPAEGYRTINRFKNRAIIALLYSSGIRVSELCSLNKESLRTDMSFTLVGKGGKQRLCFFDDRARHHIDEYLVLRRDSNPALFVSELTHDRITKGVVQLVFRNLGKKAGFKKPIHPHILRHSFATDLLRSNTNLLYVSKFLGHASVQTTEMYTHVVDEDLRRIYREKHSS